MSFPRYAEYKDSGVEWLGKVPVHWRIMPIRALAKAGADGFTDGDWIESPFITDEGVRLIQTGNIGVGAFREQGFRYVSEATFRKLRCTEVFPNDLLICRLAEPVGRACLAPTLESRMITSVDVCILKPSSAVDPKFVIYFLSSEQYLAFMDSVGRGGTRQRVSRSFLGSVKAVIPPYCEQQTISAFLDHETARIDALIEEQQRLIELLKEKRQAVISHAVTKGLDPDVPMKDSGVEWLGEVPAHWEVKPLKHIATYNDEVLPENTPADYEIRYVEISDVDERRGIVGCSNHTFDSAPSRARRVLRHGDVLISTVRTYLRAISPVKNPPKNLIGSTGFAVIRPVHQEYVSALLGYALRAEGFMSEVIARSVGVSYPAINATDLVSLKVPVPPFDEQSAIAAFLDHETARADALVEEANQGISLLQERRSALISAAVTGKIDVREWRAESNGFEADLQKVAEQDADYSTREARA